MSGSSNVGALDLAVIGAGPAGLAAAARARRLGLREVVVFDRNERPGGILPQCIHPGFGLLRYGEELDRAGVRLARRAGGAGRSRCRSS